jgi:hypothetical protein
VFDATIEAPVTIRNPDKPIGTHVFTAMARDGAGLRWTAVTIDSGDDLAAENSRVPFQPRPLGHCRRRNCCWVAGR